MIKRLVIGACLSAIVIIIILAVSNSSVDESIISQTISVDALYKPENNTIEITYVDVSEKTDSVIIEILGMDETFHKEFSQQSFVETVQIISPPKYGWATMPVTFSIIHNQFGEIGLKIEIHEQDEPKSRIVYMKTQKSTDLYIILPKFIQEKESSQWNGFGRDLEEDIEADS